MRNIAILASGSGTNAENIIKYFSTKKNAQVSLVLSNNRNAMVLKRAEAHNIRSLFFERKEFYVSGKVLRYMTYYKIDFIVLAGFLWLVPENILDQYSNRIVNIHPALLPAYGGKGMYGDAIHKAVIANNERESGITIHYVDRHYDAGDIIFQAKCPVNSDDTPESLAKKIHDLEYRHYPVIIEQLTDSLPDFSFNSPEKA